MFENLEHLLYLIITGSCYRFALKFMQCLKILVSAHSSDQSLGNFVMHHVW